MTAINDIQIENFVRAETHNYFEKFANSGQFGKIIHTKTIADVAHQDVIRMNRDTLYSAGLFDLRSPLTINLPEPDGRFQSLAIINEDHFVQGVYYGPKEVKITEELAQSRYVYCIIRTFVDPNSPEDIKKANKLQDAISWQQETAGVLELPRWNTEKLNELRSKILELTPYLGSSENAFGKKGEVDSLLHFFGTAFGWGGNPKEEATYLSYTVEKNDGRTPYSLCLKDVPVNGFWSVTVYNKDGFLEKNEKDIYSINNVTAKRASDGSVTVHFGGDSSLTNRIPITNGWNYVLRLYRPRPEILKGQWQAPKAQPQLEEGASLTH